MFKGIVFFLLVPDNDAKETECAIKQTCRSGNLMLFSIEVAMCA